MRGVGLSAGRALARLANGARRNNSKGLTELQPSPVQEALHRAQGWFARSFLLPQAPAMFDTTFDTDAFLDGAKDAYCAVHEAFAEGDTESLRPMVTQRVLSAFEHTLTSYRDAGLSMELSLESIDDAYITGIGLVSDTSLGLQQLSDPARSSDPVYIRGRKLARLGQPWLSITVRYRTRERYRLLRCVHSSTCLSAWLQDTSLIAHRPPLSPTRL